MSDLSRTKLKQMNKQVNRRFPKVVAWSLVVLWMGIIFWFSHQPAQESANLSLRVFRVSGQVMNHWQLAGLAGFILVFNIFLIWLTRRSTPGWAKWLLLLCFLGFCAAVVYTLVYILRPRYTWFSLDTIQSWLAHRVIRKGAHFVIYLFLGMILKNALNVSGIKGFNSFAIALGVCMLYAVTDEIHQIFVPGRRALVQDVVIDTVGAFVGILLYTIIEWISGHRTPWQAFWNIQPFHMKETEEPASNKLEDETSSS